MRLTHRTRLLVSLGVILSVSFLSLSTVNYLTMRRTLMRAEELSGLPLMRENIYSDILKDLLPSKYVASSMAADSFLIDWVLRGEKDVDAVERYLRDIQDRFGFFSAFYVSAITGTYYHSEGILKTLSRDDDHDVWFYRFIESGKTYELDVDTNEAAAGRLTIFVNFRLEDFDGNLLGVTGVGLEMEGFSRFLAERQRKYNRTIYLADANGTIRAHSNTSLVELVSMYEQPGLKEIAGKLLRASDEPVDGSYRVNGTTILVTTRYMPEIDWFIIVEQSEEALLVVPLRNLIRTLLVGLATSVVVIVVSLLTVNYFQKRVQRLATTDGLTGLPNRRAFESGFERFVYRRERYGTRFSVILTDIDRFKQINDTYGHLHGDAALVAASRIMRRIIRPTDLLARWGGDEFILLTECDLRRAIGTAERLRAEIESARIDGAAEAGGRMTISLGVAEYGVDDTIETIVARADRALYDAKERGRGGVASIPPS